MASAGTVPCSGLSFKRCPACESHAICDLLGLDAFHEDHLYRNLACLSEQQEAIEKRLFRQRYGRATPQLFLYDVTSSYLEGVQEVLAAFGYNRDRKKGKLQLVLGLLAGPDGTPVVVRVFAGNTQNSKTVAEQVRTLELVVEEEVKEQAAELDGCYVIKTDLSAEVAAAETIHDRYKDLAQVERAFRTFRGHLKVRPTFVRREASTRGHVFVVMLAYLLY